MTPSCWAEMCRLMYSPKTSKNTCGQHREDGADVLRNLSDNDWLYHLTRKHIAALIKQAGMMSWSTRIGRTVANPRGAFVGNRKEKEWDKQVQKIKGYITEILASGGT